MWKAEGKSDNVVSGQLLKCRMHARSISSVTFTLQIRTCGTTPRLLTERVNYLHNVAGLVVQSVKAQLQYKDTLNVTFSRKYDKGTLVHITDRAFEWILDLEQEQVNFLNSAHMATNQEDLGGNALRCTTANNRLLENWKAPSATYLSM